MKQIIVQKTFYERRDVLLMSENNNNLPALKENQQLIKVQKNMSLTDSLRKLRITAGNIGLGLAGITASAVAVAALPFLPGIVPLAICTTGIVQVAKGMQNCIYKSEPSIMFIAKKRRNGSLEIFQDALQIPTYLRGISILDKSCIMGLQTLVGFERYKTEMQQKRRADNKK